MNPLSSQPPPQPPFFILTSPLPFPTLHKQNPLLFLHQYSPQLSVPLLSKPPLPTLPQSYYSIPSYPMTGQTFPSFLTHSQFYSPFTPQLTPFPTFQPSISPANTQNTNGPTLRSPKLDLAPFDGSEPH